MAVGLFGAAAATAAAPAGVARAAAPQYTLDNLGIPDAAGNSDQGSAALGINRVGTATGYLVGSNTYSQPFVGTPGKIAVLPLLGGRGGNGQAINNNGQVTGYSHITGSTPTEASPEHATVWSKSGTVTDLGTLPGGTNSDGTAINDLGQVAGNADVASGDMHAFKTTANGQGPLVDLGTLGAGVASGAGGINNAGIVAGYSYLTDTNSPFVATYWDAAGTIHQIPSFGGAYSQALAVNHAGFVTGNADVDLTEATSDALLFDIASGHLTDLGGSPNARFPYASGLALNDANTVVGTEFNDSYTDGRALLFENGQVYDLNTLVDAPGWTLQYAWGINDAGQIVGQGVDPAGYEHAFLLTPTGVAMPEPATASVAALATVATLGRRRRR